MLDKRAAANASAFLTEYSIEKGIYVKINYFNDDQLPALIDLPTRYYPAFQGRLILTVRLPRRR